MRRVSVICSHLLHKGACGPSLVVSKTSEKNLETILVEKKEKIAIVTLNRERVLNAINGKMIEELISTFEELDRDESISVVVLTGKGKSFSAGADLKSSFSGGIQVSEYEEK